MPLRRRVVTPVWFVFVDCEFRRTLRASSYVDVPSNVTVHDFLDRIKAKAGTHLTLTTLANGLRTPQSSTEIQQPNYLANLDRLPEAKAIRKGEGGCMATRTGRRNIVTLRGACTR